MVDENDRQGQSKGRKWTLWVNRLPLFFFFVVDEDDRKLNVHKLIFSRAVNLRRCDKLHVTAGQILNTVKAFQVFS